MNARKREVQHLGINSNHICAKDIKQGDILSPFLFNFALELSIRNFHQFQVILEFNGTSQLVVYADVMKLFENSIDIIKVYQKL
jgi:sRNA-binding regulator protein Hfq